MELDDPTIEEFIASFEEDWKQKVTKITTEKKADDLLNVLLGSPKLIEAR